MIYPSRFVMEPRKREAYTVACDMVAVYGGDFADWNYENFPITREEAHEIWGMALSDMNGNSRYDWIAA